MARRKNQEGCDLNMTPMIDVVFQLIIFFIVTINIADAKDEDVRLELGVHGAEVETGGDAPASALVIDVSSKGRVSINNRDVDTAGLRQIMKQRYARYGSTFDVCVRGDARARHDYVRKVMDVCTSEGVGRVTFLAVKDARTPAQIKFLADRERRSRR
ncbi:MAG: biopolymer transporter ExbD [Kiritimatiellae bacterium]|nr:biopolymer transporter ExbD [Kiritimatiellia bacterium]